MAVTIGTRGWFGAERARQARPGWCSVRVRDGPGDRRASGLGIGSQQEKGGEREKVVAFTRGRVPKTASETTLKLCKKWGKRDLSRPAPLEVKITVAWCARRGMPDFDRRTVSHLGSGCGPVRAIWEIESHLPFWAFRTLGVSPEICLT